MTKHYMTVETGSVCTEEETREWFEEARAYFEEEDFPFETFEEYLEKNLGSGLCEVEPAVENPDDSNPDDWKEL